jgi:hypothetical protein
MFKTDKALLFPVTSGAGVGSYVGICPPDILIKLQVIGPKLSELFWAVVTTIVVTTVSFFVTRLLKEIFKSKKTN